MSGLWEFHKLTMDLSRIWQHLLKSCANGDNRKLSDKNVCLRNARMHEAN